MSIARSLLSTALVGTIAALAAPAAVQAQAHARSADSDQAYGPQKLVDKAASVVTEMRGDPKILPVLSRAVGLYIIPEYGNAGFIIGGKGGAGVVTTRTSHGWSAPAFFNTGGLNIGLQAGASGGSIVYMLMDRKAVDAFRGSTKFSLGAGAGLAVVKYSDAAQVSANKGDAVVWTDMKGAYAGATVGVTGVRFDQKRTREYYGREVGVNALLAGQVTAPGVGALTRVLPR